MANQTVICSVYALHLLGHPIYVQVLHLEGHKVVLSAQWDTFRAMCERDFQVELSFAFWQNF